MCCRVLTSTCVRAFFTIHWGPPSSRIRNRKSLNNKIVEITICQCPREETLELDFQMLLLAFKSYFCKKKVRRVRRNSENKFCIIMWFNFSVFIVLGHYYQHGIESKERTKVISVVLQSLSPLGRFNVEQAFSDLNKSLQVKHSFLHKY